MEAKAEVKATCTEDGRAATVGCAVCDYIVDPSPALLDKSEYACATEYELAKQLFIAYWTMYEKKGGEHAWSEPTEAIPADCCNDGVKSYSTCTRCGELSVADIVIPASGEHKYVDFTTAIPATCTTDGCTEGWVCENGGEVISQFVGAFGHDYDFEAEDFAGVLPTCTANAVCFCGEELEDTKLGHSYVDGEAKVATCLENGWEAFVYCDREGCEHTTFDFEKAAAMTAAKHWEAQIADKNYTEVAAVPATCEAAGNSKYYICNDCGTIRNSASKSAKAYATLEESPLYIEIKAHVLDTRADDYEAKVNATCEADGQEASGTCKNCEKFITGDVIDALGHNFETNGGKAATCKTDAVCGNKSACEYFKNGKAVLEGTKLGHDWVEVDVVYETCTVSGIRAHYECANEGCDLWALENEEETEKKNDGLVDGYKEYTANNVVFTIKAQGHGYENNWVKVEAKAPTHAEAGWSEYYTCGQCDDAIAVKSGTRFVIVDEIPVLAAIEGHNCPIANINTCSKYFVCEDIVVENEDGEEVIVHYGCGKVYANVNFKPCQPDEDNVCVVCGKEACKHPNMNKAEGVCPDCNYCAHVAHNANGVCLNVDCAYAVGHDYKLQENNTFYCAGCKDTCSHNLHVDKNFTCKVCGNEIAGESHDFTTGTCPECELPCPHADYNTVADECNVCGQKCAHDSHNFDNEKCDACGTKVVHDWKLQADGSRYCKLCDVTCDHVYHWDTGLCAMCGYEVEHTYDLTKVETVMEKKYVNCTNDYCGKQVEYKTVCPHTGNHSQELVCADCGAKAADTANKYAVEHRYAYNNGVFKCEATGCGKVVNTTNVNLSGSINAEINTEADSTAAVVVTNGANVTITGGEYYAYGESSNAIWAKEGSTVTIKGGEYYAGEETGVGEVIYASGGATIIIEGGIFMADATYDGRSWVLNCQDNNGKIIVKGGTFYGFNPEASEVDLNGEVEIADGYECVEVSEGVWTVQKAE